MWQKWHLWSFLLRVLARRQGFLDPMAVFTNLQRFGKPSDVWIPTELLRSGMVLQARGLMNSQAIQHNLDWVWPYWVKRQFDPVDNAFIPRAFSIAHINLTHRNWTAVGLPDFGKFPIVDPRGLVTPHYDGWSVDAWILSEDKNHLIPSAIEAVEQKLHIENTLAVETACRSNGSRLYSTAEVVTENGEAVCRVTYSAWTESKAWLAVSLRPYNPEGVSFINEIRLLKGKNGWKVDDGHEIHLDSAPDRTLFSNYAEGDVFSKVFSEQKKSDSVRCPVGMASAVALYALTPKTERQVTFRAPFIHGSKTHANLGSWYESLYGQCQLKIPDSHFQFLYDTALRTLVLHSPGDVYPGPYTYKRFWFRDAAFILEAMLGAGLARRVEKVLDRFPSRQTALGHYLSQDGEWDSNGQALWILDRFCRLTNRKPKPEWFQSIRLGAQWIMRKRSSTQKDPSHAGLLPAGFSAEHLGPNDFYYWDDFWGVAGLRSAASLMKLMEEKDLAAEFGKDADDFMLAIEKSLELAEKRLGHQAMPASPTRRMDAGAVGSLAAGYPLRLWPPQSERLKATADFLVANCFLKGGFYQEISHSGINAYLTLEVAQVLLRSGDSRFFDLVKSIALMASPTGQWPEAIHPKTAGGCMGDGQHVWAAAEWVLMMRSFFVREEENALILCSGIPSEWLKKGETLSFGPALTAFGKVSVTLGCEDKLVVSLEAQWSGPRPEIEIRCAGQKVRLAEGQTSAELDLPA